MLGFIKACATLGFNQVISIAEGVMNQKIYSGVIRTIFEVLLVKQTATRTGFDKVNQIVISKSFRTFAIFHLMQSQGIIRQLRNSVFYRPEVAWAFQKGEIVRFCDDCFGAHYSSG